MLTPDQITKYHADSNHRAGYCANCNKTLHSLEIVHVQTRTENEWCYAGKRDNHGVQ